MHSAAYKNHYLAVAGAITFKILKNSWRSPMRPVLGWFKLFYRPSPTSTIWLRN